MPLMTTERVPFELNFSLADPKLVSLADSTTNQSRQSLTNSSLLEWGRLPEVAKLAQVNAQANLRKYYQDLRRKKKEEKMVRVFATISGANSVHFSPLKAPHI